MYDIIGDVHGHAQLLKEAFKTLGYKKVNGIYSHQSRKAIFVGDFINRGPQIRKTLNIVRKMVDSGNAHAILGNHEVNAILYYLKDKKGKKIIPKANKNRLSLVRTLQQFLLYPEELKSYIKWFRSLPLYLDFGDIRIVHACWMDKNIHYLHKEFKENGIKKSKFREIYFYPDSQLGVSFWQTLKGIILPFPSDMKIRDNRGVFRRSVRIKWWENPFGKTFRELTFENKGYLPAYTIPPQIIPEFEPYPENASIVFFGHYCKASGPYLIRDNVCCLDSCITGTKTLQVYSWNGEKKLKPENLIKIF